MIGDQRDLLGNQTDNLREYDLLWGRSTDPRRVSVRLQEELAVTPQVWQAVDETDIYVWIRSIHDRGSALFSIAESEGLTWRSVVTLREWGNVFASPIANYVLRELQPESVDEALPLIHGQTAAVANRPGCQGCYLGAQVNAPANLLGITFWLDRESFRQYMAWAMQHPWRNVIGPITVDVPLRLLTQRINN